MGGAKSKVRKSPSISPGIMKMKKLFEKNRSDIDSDEPEKGERKVTKVINSFEVLMNSPKTVTVPVTK